LQRDVGAIALAERDRGHGVDAALEIRQHQVARESGALQVALRGDPHGEANDGQPGDQQHADAPRVHGAPRTASGSLAAGAGRAPPPPRPPAATRRPTPANSKGAPPTLRRLNSVPTRPTAAARAARPARSSLRIRSFSVWK